MVLFEDVRNKPGKHENIHRYCEKHGIKIVRQCLNVGDYQIANKGDIIVDTKESVSELASNVFQEHRRFKNELERAKEYGIQLIVLTEESLPGGRLDNWRTPLRRDGTPMFKFSPEVLRKALLTMQERYGVKFRFVDGRSTGKVLIEYLEGKRK